MLAKRLIYSTSSSEELEMNMINRLKVKEREKEGRNQYINIKKSQLLMTCFSIRKYVVWNIQAS